MSTFKCHICGGETARDEFVSELLEVGGRRFGYIKYRMSRDAEGGGNRSHDQRT